jgi:hypothetical protein
MKPYLIVLVLLSTLGLRAQTFSLNLGNSSTTDAPVEEFVVGTITMLNTSDAPVVLRWSLIEKTTPSVWDYSYCDFNTCYTGDQINGTMAVIQPGNEGFIKVNAYTTAASSAYFKFNVWDENDPANEKIIEFWFNGIANIKKEEPTKALSIYPNPSISGSPVSIENIPLNSSVKIINALGQVVYNTKALQGTLVVNEQLPKGVYIVHVSIASLTETRKLIIR